MVGTVQAVFVFVIDVNIRAREGIVGIVEIDSDGPEKTHKIGVVF
jgi:hypothetical protein